MVSFPAWPADIIRNLGHSEREYWVQWGKALYERKEKRTSDLISKLAEYAANLLGVRRRR